ncbi:DNA gyrase subunit A [Candidatus Fokinia solitaria]|uniref:DNA topoisomerase (ATP-hydrolyzing) n=1 Tax=Candidatus Fokinia solitaria TaxID=1802984 RepID=A0A2U8BRV5_9RICK|nr:DNA gyrase subunit A [Candidatus Fokinia solitaria]AWD33068.1 DNA gyrase subunit A [Candidatus Fokinia solitaria]
MKGNVEKTEHSSVNVSIDLEMREAYLNYAMSVIVSRSLPDARDGLKPVHRRILYSMGEQNNNWNRPYRKSARIVGEVLGKYHPHGDTAIYDAYVRMAQPFSLYKTLIDGQGNFGSIDGDSPAQMRYTEGRLQKISNLYLLADIDKDTVAFKDNYDNSEREPTVLPARFPNLLVNGASGIAVGMATNIPPHNVVEVLNACLAYIENPDITIQEVVSKYIPAPDFPTGCKIIDYDKCYNAMLTGRGSITIRGKTHIEENNNRASIVITEIPYQTNKAEFVKSMEALARDKVIDGIAEIRDESNKLGIRVVVELRREAAAEVVLNHLYKHTVLETYFAINMLALYNGRPTVLNVLDVVKIFVEFRQEVITRRSRFLLNKASSQAHVIFGLLMCIDNISRVIEIIRGSRDVAIARERLLTEKWSFNYLGDLAALTKVLNIQSYEDGVYTLSQQQCKAILDMRLQRLTGLEKQKVAEEFEALLSEIKFHLEILNSRTVLMEEIKNEILVVRDDLNDSRKTEVTQMRSNMSEDDFFSKEDVVILLTKSGYMKRTSLQHYKDQRRGGKGKSGVSTYEDDSLAEILVTTTHHNLLFFSNAGNVYMLKVYKVPATTLQSTGRAIVNFIPLRTDEKITNVISVDREVFLHGTQEMYVCFCTSRGSIKRNSLLDFKNIPSGGKIAIKLDKDDYLIGVSLCTANQYVMLSTKMGKSVCFPVANLRVFKGRASEGVKGVRLVRKDDSVISMCMLPGIDIDYSIKSSYLKIPSDVRLRMSEEFENGKDITELAKSALEKYWSYSECSDVEAVSELDVSEQESVAEDISELNDDIEHVLEKSVIARIDGDITVDKLIELVVHEKFLLSISSNGYGKRTSSYEYRVTGRNVGGVVNMDVGRAHVIGVLPIKDTDSVILACNSGKVIRVSADSVRVTGRNTKGVRVVSLEKNDHVVSACSISSSILEESVD